MNYILFNPHSGNGKSAECAERFASECSEGARILDITEVCYSELLKSLTCDDCLTIFGGDGTINRFVNETSGMSIPCRVFYYPSGTGNDFFVDICDEAPEHPVDISDYIKGLPTVTVNGNDYRFINGVGFGIDGYCCEVGDSLKSQGKNPNYTAIAIKGLLFHFKPVNATVSVDGKTYDFKKVWIAPTMFGRYYGGGMMPTPNQDRSAADKKVSLMMFHGSGKLKTLSIFPSIFQGKHVEKEKYVTILEGKDITVTFDRPTPLQIDGETVLGVTSYTVTV